MPVRHPRGLSTLFFTEMWERFSYYGMRALLTLFMVAPVASGGMGLDTVQAASIYGTYSFSVYLLSIPGGYLADAFLGARRSVLIGGTTIALGHFALSVPSDMAFYTGLVLVAAGTGLFKPNISALVGNLYARDDERRDAGFSIFYTGINLGAFIAPFVTGFLAQHLAFKSWLGSMGFDPLQSWHWGFGAAGVGMSIAMLVFVRRSAMFETIGAAPVVSSLALRRLALVALATVALMGLVMLSDRAGFEWLRWSFIMGPAVAGFFLSRSADPELRRLAAITVFFIAATIFWAIFEQAGVTIALFADTLTNRGEPGAEFPSAWFQSLNPLFVITLAPLFAWSFLRLGARQPSSPVKFVLGLIFLALSFGLMVPAAQLTAAGKISPFWLVGMFLLQTIGELFVSPVGLSLMTRLAPPRWTGLILGLWFLAFALGSKFAGVLGGGFTAEDPNGLARFFLDQSVFVAFAAVVLLALVPWLKRQMGDVR